MSRWQRFLCYVVEWHVPCPAVMIDSMAFNRLSHCGRCGVAVMLDSQGNWFRCEAWP